MGPSADNQTVAEETLNGAQPVNDDMIEEKVPKKQIGPFMAGYVLW
jgi:hypothetical protein